MPDLHAEFCELLRRFGNIAELARQSGLSYRALTYKRERPERVTQWDVWAIERALQDKEREGEAR